MESVVCVPKRVTLRTPVVVATTSNECMFVIGVGTVAGVHGDEVTAGHGQ